MPTPWPPCSGMSGGPSESNSTASSHHRRVAHARCARALGATHRGQVARRPARHLSWKVCRMVLPALRGFQGRLRAPSARQLLPRPRATCEWTEEENLFFRLSAYQEGLLALYEKDPEFIRPATRRNEVVAFVRGGLRDLSISRTTIQWGIRCRKRRGKPPITFSTSGSTRSPAI